MIHRPPILSVGRIRGDRRHFGTSPTAFPNHRILARRLLFAGGSVGYDHKRSWAYSAAGAAGKRFTLSSRARQRYPIGRFHVCRRRRTCRRCVAMGCYTNTLKIGGGVQTHLDIIDPDPDPATSFKNANACSDFPRSDMGRIMINLLIQRRRIVSVLRVKKKGHMSCTP